MTAGLYLADIEVPGFTATVSPSILFFPEAGATRQFTVTLTRSTAQTGEYATGFLTWHGAGTTVRSPIAIQPRAVDSSESEVVLDPSTHSAAWTVRSGVNGAFPITAFGMTPGTAEAQQVAAGKVIDNVLQVPDRTKVVRFSTDVANPSDGSDLDLYVYLVAPDGGSVIRVGVSGSDSSNEEVTLVDPEPGTYVAEVVGFANAPGTDVTSYSYRTFAVDGRPNTASLTVEPSNPTVSAGDVLELTATARGLDPARRHLGWVEYLDGSGTFVVTE